MKTLNAAFLSAHILTLLVLIHVATAATENPLQNTSRHAHLKTPANATTTETRSNAVEPSIAETDGNSTIEAPSLQGNDSSTTQSTDDETLPTSPSPLQPTAPGSTTSPVPKRKTSAIPSSSVSSSTPARSAGELDGGSIVIVLLSVIVLFILILVGAFKWASHPSNQNKPTSRLILGLGERVRGGARALEDRLGFRLWPGGRGEREGDEAEMEEEEEEEKVDGKMTEVVVGVEGEKRKEEEEEDEDDDSSDDYSSMGVDDLRQSAPSGEKEEEEAEDKSTSEEGQGEEKGGKDGEREGGEEAMALVGPGSGRSEGEIEMSDVTIL